VRRIGPIFSSAIAIAVATLVLLDFILDQPTINGIGALLVDYGLILGAFAFFLGVANVLIVHSRRIVRGRQHGWISSLILIVVVLGLLVYGLTAPSGPNAPAIAFTFEYILIPLQAATFSLLAFFLLNVAYRSLRIANIESLFLLLGLLITILGVAPLGNASPALVGFREFFLSVPVTAAARGMLLGVSLGIIATGMRLLFDAPRYFK
jgi:hypothetical protein